MLYFDLVCFALRILSNNIESYRSCYARLIDLKKLDMDFYIFINGL